MTVALFPNSSCVRHVFMRKVSMFLGSQVGRLFMSVSRGGVGGDASTAAVSSGLTLILSVTSEPRQTRTFVARDKRRVTPPFRPRVHTCGSRSLTFLGSSRDADDVRDVGGQFGKKRDANRLANPAADVPHQLRVLSDRGAKCRPRLKSRAVTAACPSHPTALSSTAFLRKTSGRTGVGLGCPCLT